MFFKRSIETEILESEYTINSVVCINNVQIAKITCMPIGENSLYICDILHTRKNRDYKKGYGSMMMEKLIEYAKEHNYTHIYGNLSTVDLEHKDRLHHFYEKFGFKITEYPKVENCYYGRIDLYL